MTTPRQKAAAARKRGENKVEASLGGTETGEGGVEVKRETGVDNARRRSGRSRGADAVPDGNIANADAKVSE